MIKMKMTKGKSPVLIWTDDVESSAHEQLSRMADLSIVHSHIAVMPDVHMGKGATVGSVIPTREAIIPAAVGVDIGCGMCALRTSLHADQLPESLRQLRNQIERDVPVGFDMHSNRRARFEAAAAVEPLRGGCRGRTRTEADPGSTSRHRFEITQQGCLGTPDRYPGWRQPLHRAVPGRRRPRLGHAAFRQPRHR
jgi:tRNA-splicing ligase RtcB